MRLFLQIMIILVACAMAAGLSNLVHPNKIAWVKDWDNVVLNRAEEEGVKLVTLDQAAEISESFSHTILDARSLEDYDNGHIPGSFSLPFKNFEEVIVEVAPMLEGAPIMVYCSGIDCDEALDLLLKLRESGYEEIVLFADGWEAWKTSGRELE